MMTDDELIEAMFGRDTALAQIAVRIYEQRHANDPPVKEPPHCSECFEGCDKCQKN